MEPRIATLLGDSATHDRSTLDPISLLPPPPAAPRRPLPVGPNPVGEEPRTIQAAHHHENIPSDDLRTRSQKFSPHHRQKSGVPIAEVLNDAGPTTFGPQSLSTVPFSGRLSDILLDPSQQRPNKRRKVEDRTETPALPNNENTLLKLPKLPQLPKKTARRPRIPPLLQGLHQPPPLPPEGRLFPPITGDGGGFGREIGDRVPVRSPAGLETEKVKEKGKEKQFESDNLNAGGSSISESNTLEFSTTLTYDKSCQGQENAEISPEKKDKRKQESKKRNKWTEFETKDLLHGVSKFGIGNWKKILNHAEYNFNLRSTVDLKDRFRTCCPGEGVKKTAHKSSGTFEDATVANEVGTVVAGVPSNDGGSIQEVVSATSLMAKSKSGRKPRKDKYRTGAAELAEMGIQAPFFKVNRRERREFTEQDDENLLRGFEQYGPVWHKMRADRDLGFTTRQTTDLRDRFRIRYPERFAKAGYKVKPKDEIFLKEKEETESQKSFGDVMVQQKAGTIREKENEPGSDSAVTIPTSSIPMAAGVRTHTLQPYMNSFPVPFPDMGLEDDGEGRNSPVTLNRNIFEWADANPSQSNTLVVPTNFPSAATQTNDVNMNFFTSIDGMHINPLATLNLPTASYTNNSSMAAPVFQTTSGQLNLSLPPNSTTNAPPTSTPTSTINTMSSSTSAKQTLNALLRTPNLPNIVYPHVPVASARGAVHNLPPPADLLSGMDFEMRPESHTPAAVVVAGFVMDDTFSFAATNANNSNSAPTLAPLMGGTAGRIGLLALDGRGLTDDQLGDRSLLNSSI